MNKKKLIRQRIRCKKCNDIIESKHVHDYKHCTCGSISIDGGLDYKRWGYPEEPIEDWIEDLSEYK